MIPQKSVNVALFIILLFISGCFSLNGPSKTSMDRFNIIEEAYHKGDYRTALKMLTDEIDSGKFNGRQLGRLFALRAIVNSEAGETQKAWDDCIIGIQLIPDGKEYEKLKQLMKKIRFDKVESILIGGIPLSQGWNGLKWGASVEDFKTRFPKHKKVQSSWETGEGNELFYGIWLKSRYSFNDKDEFYQVILYPLKKDRKRLTNSMVEIFGWTDDDKALWNHSNIEIKVIVGGIAASIRNTDLDLLISEKLTTPSGAVSPKDVKSKEPKRHQVGIVKEINSDWGLVIIRLNNNNSVKVNDSIFSYSSDGEQLLMIVDKITSSKAVAKLSKNMLRKIIIDSEVFKLH
jgi:hypothetical protein